jgi:hypothetical protein
MNTVWFLAWAVTRYETHEWPLDLFRCRYYHWELWQEIGAGRYWCRACYYHRSP